jgi:hypothetical protein
MSPEITVEDIQNPNKVEDVKPEPKAKESSEAQYVRMEELDKIQKQLNGLSYMGRKMDELSKKFDNWSPQPQQPTMVTKDEDKDEYDKLVEKDWKAAVRKLAKEEAETLRAIEREAEAKKRMEVQQLTLLEQSKKTVIDRYPQLNDESSEISQKYREVVQKHPEYLSNEFGPELAMRSMEDELRNEGRIDEFSKKIVDKEVDRRTRVGATAVPRAASPNSNKSILTKEDKDFCDFNGIKYDAFLKNKKMLGSEKQTEV